MKTVDPKFSGVWLHHVRPNPGSLSPNHPKASHLGRFNIKLGKFEYQAQALLQVLEEAATARLLLQTLIDGAG